MQLKPGSRWKNAVGETEVIAVRAGPGSLDLRCQPPIHDLLAALDEVVEPSAK
jgi:hypothetical protein